MPGSPEPAKAEEKLQRWRLILGQESQKRFENMGGGGLTGEQDMMDLALAAIYNRTESGGFGPGAAGRGAGSGPSQITDSPMEPLWSISSITVHLFAAVVLVLSKK